MKLARLQPSIRTLFADLLQQVRTAPLGGSVYTRERDGSRYIYAKISVGRQRVDRFVGKAGNPEAEAEAASIQRGGELAKGRRSLVSLLKRHGLAGPDRTLGAALDAVAYAGLFTGGAVLVGTGAYMTFEPLVGSRLPASSMTTGDLDLATAELALSAAPAERMLDVLRRADPTFEGVPPLDQRRPSSRFRNAEGYLVDLLTPTRRRTDANPMPLPKLDAGAAPLQHLDWLIADPVPTVALWGAGVPVVVPQPARYAIHKLILAQRRDPANRHKRSKDLDQATALIETLLEDDPFAIEDAIDEAQGRGREGWATPITRSLQEIGLERLVSGR